jgi:hypothetical protein
VGGAAATLAIAWWKMENAHQGLTIRPSRLWLAKSIFSAWGVQVKDTGLLLVSCWYWLVLDGTGWSSLGMLVSELAALGPRVTVVPKVETRPPSPPLNLISAADVGTPL